MPFIPTYYTATFSNGRCVETSAIPGEHAAAPQHTPGPWYADKLEDRNAYSVFPRGATHALVTVHASAGAPLEHAAATAANARLIAAAPALLAVLQDVAAYWAGGDVPAELDARMRAVIAAATGEV